MLLTSVLNSLNPRSLCINGIHFSHKFLKIVFGFSDIFFYIGYGSQYGFQYSTVGRVFTPHFYIRLYSVDCGFILLHCP